MLRQLFDSWVRVVTQPSVATFDAERPGAAMDRVVVGVLIASVIAGIGSAIGQLVLTVIGAGMGADSSQVASGLVTAVASPFFVPLFSLVGFFVGNGILYLLARLLGGHGDFVVHLYLLSLFYAPITIVNGLLSIIPIVGGLAGLPLAIYSLVLTTLALKSAHGLSTGRAVAVWLIPAAVVALLALCALVMIVGMIGLAVTRGGGGM